MMGGPIAEGGGRKNCSPRCRGGTKLGIYKGERETLRAREKRREKPRGRRGGGQKRPRHKFCCRLWGREGKSPTMSHRSEKRHSVEIAGGYQIRSFSSRRRGKEKQRKKKMKRGLLFRHATTERSNNSTIMYEKKGRKGKWERERGGGGNLVS